MQGILDSFLVLGGLAILGGALCVVIGATTRLRRWLSQRRDGTVAPDDESKTLSTGLWLLLVGFMLGLIGENSEDAGDLTRKLAFAAGFIVMAAATVRWVLRKHAFSTIGLVRAMFLGCLMGASVALASPDDSPLVQTILGGTVGWGFFYVSSAEREQRAEAEAKWKVDLPDATVERLMLVGYCSGIAASLSGAVVLAMGSPWTSVRIAFAIVAGIGAITFVAVVAILRAKRRPLQPEERVD